MDGSLPQFQRAAIALTMILPIEVTYFAYSGLRLLPRAYFPIVTRLLPGVR